MPMARALKLAPDAIVVPPRFDAYAEASEQVFAIFDSRDAAGRAAVARRGVPRRHRVAGAVRRARPTSPRRSARADRRRARAARVGGHRRGEVRRRRSPPTWPSRTASARCRRTASRAFLAPLPVGAAVGRGAEERRHARGARARRPSATSRAHDPEWLERTARAIAAAHLWELAHGIDDRARDSRPRREEHRRRGHLRRGPVGRRGAARRTCTPRRCGSARRLRRGRPARAGRAAEAEARRLHAGHPPRDARRADRRRPGCSTAHAPELLAREPAAPAPVRLTGVSAQNLVARRRAAARAVRRRRPRRAEALNRALDAIADRFGAAPSPPRRRRRRRPDVRDPVAGDER